MFSFIPKNQHTTKNLYTLPIPVEVQDKEGYGLGIDSTYNSHIRYGENGERILENPMLYRVFDGTEEWEIKNMGKPVAYALLIVGDAGTVVDEVLRSTHFDYYKVSSGNTGTGIRVLNSSAAEYGAIITVRPYNAESMTLESWKAQLANWYSAGDPLAIVYASSTPVVEDISDILPADNYIPVQGGGTVRAVNEHGYDVPSEITFITKEVQA